MDNLRRYRLRAASYRTDPHFGISVPVMVADVEPGILDPRSTWADVAAYDRQARVLVQMFIANFGKFADGVDAAVRGASPQLALAAD